LTGAQSAGIPTSARPISTPSTAAYAGPTFHASPAPSALPIPTFYSKSVPDSPGLRRVEASKRDPGSNDPDLSTPPSARILSNQVHREESPLDLFFKADREEKARARSASSTHTTATATGPFQPPPASPRDSQTPPAPTSQYRTHQGHVKGISAGGMFAMELDGPSSPGAAYGPAFSTPYAERMNAARSGNTPCGPTSSANYGSQQPIDRSEALKAYLFSGPPAQPQVPTSGNPGTTGYGSLVASAAYRDGSPARGGSRSAGLHPRPQQSTPSFPIDSRSSNNTAWTSGRASGLRQEVTPTKTPTKILDRNENGPNTPTPSRIHGKTTSSDPNGVMGHSHVTPPLPTSPFGGSSGTTSADLQSMENSLRKILKLDSTGVLG